MKTNKCVRCGNPNPLMSWHGIHLCEDCIIQVKKEVEEDLKDMQE